ncbi:nitroreductase family protein [Hydrocarboniphaga sp.]|uniref:nitroreductase family protein n=1 Tax=Hydrocarboniphaga sp. TaxID=2033016 RepID=UPI0034519CD2
MKSRRSIRSSFLATRADPPLLRKLIELAARAPSGGNPKPWRITVLGGQEVGSAPG